MFKRRKSVQCAISRVTHTYVGCIIKALASQSHQINCVLHSSVQTCDAERDGSEELFLVLEGCMCLLRDLCLFRRWEGRIRTRNLV